eukprot:UN09976
MKHVLNMQVCVKTPHFLTGVFGRWSQFFSSSSFVSSSKHTFYHNHHNKSRKLLKRNKTNDVFRSFYYTIKRYDNTVALVYIKLNNLL